MPFRLSLFFKDALGRGKVRTFQQEALSFLLTCNPGASPRWTGAS